MKMKRLLAGLCLGASMMWGADVSGKWKATVATPNGNTMDVQMNFKQDGEKLTGTVSNHEGEAPILEGKVAGDKVSFAVERDNGLVRLNGVVVENELKFAVEMGDRKLEFTAKREAAK